MLLSLDFGAFTTARTFYYVKSAELEERGKKEREKERENERGISG